MTVLLEYISMTALLEYLVCLQIQVAEKWSSQSSGLRLCQLLVPGNYITSQICFICILHV